MGKQGERIDKLTKPVERFNSSSSTMKVVACLIALFAFSTSASAAGERFCPDERKINTGWNHRHCLAQVYHGNVSDIRSTLPAKYLAVYDDSVPRSALAHREAFRDWILADCRSRSRKLNLVVPKHFREETSFMKEIKFNACVHAKKLDDDMRRRKDTACVNSRSLFHRTSELFIDCYRSKSYAKPGDICWNQVLAQGASAERYVNWACSKQDNFELVDDCLDDLIMETDSTSSCSKALKMRKELIHRSESSPSRSVSHDTESEKLRMCQDFLSRMPRRYRRSAFERSSNLQMIELCLGLMSGRF